MYVVELALQAVRGFAGSVRVSLKAGYTVLKAEGPAPLSGIISSLWYNDGRGGDSVFLAPGAAAGKAGLTLAGNDRGVYRLARDLGGAGALHRLDEVQRKFEVVSQDAAEITQFLRGTVGIPPKTTFEQLFCFRSEQLPSRRTKKSAPAQAKPASLPQSRPVQAAGDLAEAEARLSELRKEQVLSKEIDQLQFRLDGLSGQLFELEAKLRETDGLKAAIREAEASRDAAPTAASLGLPEDVLARLERYPQLVQKRDDALARIEAERAQVEEAPRPTHIEPVWKDSLFLGGLLAGLGILLAATQLDGSLRYLALLDIPAFGFCAFLALRYVDDLQGATHTSNRGELLAAREKKIHDDFVAQSATVKDALKAARVENADELREQLQMRDRYEIKVQELCAQLAQYESTPEVASAAASYKRLKDEQESINAQLLEKGGGYVRDLREVEREIAKVEESIQLAKRPAPAQEAPAAAPVAAASLEDPCPAVMKLGADLFTCDVPTLAAQLSPRATQYLGALTDRRFQGLEADKDGNATVLTSAGKVPAGSLPPKDLDLVYLALRLSLVESYSVRAKVPVILEEAFGSVDEAKLTLVARMLKHLGSLTQVLHVSSAPAFVGAADTVSQV